MIQRGFGGPCLRTSKALENRLKTVRPAEFPTHVAELTSWKLSMTPMTQLQP